MVLRKFYVYKIYINKILLRYRFQYLFIFNYRYYLFHFYIFAAFQRYLFFVCVRSNWKMPAYLPEIHTILRTWDTLRMLNRITQFSDDVLWRNIYFCNIPPMCAVAILLILIRRVLQDTCTSVGREISFPPTSLQIPSEKVLSFQRGKRQRLRAPCFIQYTPLESRYRINIP